MPGAGMHGPAALQQNSDLLGHKAAAEKSHTTPCVPEPLTIAVPSHTQFIHIKFPKHFIL